MTELKIELHVLVSYYVYCEPKFFLLVSFLSHTEYEPITS